MSALAQRNILTTSLIWAFAMACVLIYFLSHPTVHWSHGADSPSPIAIAPTASAAMAMDAPPQQMDAPLSPVQLTAEQMQNIGMTTGTAEYKDLSDDLRATGSVAINDRLLSYVQVRFSGSIRKVFANATYQYVRKGEPLFTVYSPELVATQQEYLLANENQRALSGSSIRDVAAGARSLSTAAERRLAQWEIPESEIAELKRSGKVLSELTIQSPVSGYITERNALPNMYAEPGTRLYTIADLSHVWVNAQVFQCDVGRLKPGDQAAITVDAYPQKTFIGRVEEVLPQVDATTRTVPVRLSINNTGLLLKPGMFVNVDLKSAMGRRLVVPASSVLQTGLKQIVFLNKGDGRIEPRDVVLGPQIGDNFVILKGLEPHQAIVTSANFLIDSESQMQAASGANMPSMANSSANGGGSVSHQSVRIEFTTNPNPPQKGTNALRVKLTDGKGSMVSGADVAVAFYMAAMPEMGMAAMKTNTKLTEKDGGIYENTSELPCGGTWQVTVMVKQHGQLVATKKFSVNAKGGM
jgi:Cu(I)/Ag(I) efflux system membrane fusion protein/cobalt-zinc-cadmium efflux system membrane fusion protein